MLDKILSFIADRLSAIGTAYTAAWTASRTDQFSQAVTGQIVLPAGTYVIQLKVPVYTDTTKKYWFGVRNLSQSALEFSNHDSRTYIAQFTSQTTVCGETQQSGATSFASAYLNRGYLKALRIR